MELSTVRALARLNQRFYDDHAEDFADSRPRLPEGVQRVLAGVAAGARVLEVGCGDGKVGRALARQGVGGYVGLDASEAMLERAARYTTNDEGPLRETDAVIDPFVVRHLPPIPSGGSSPAPHPFGGFVFTLANLTSPSWSSVIAGESFDWVLAFAVFHHLPGYDLRAGVLRTLADHLAPGGRVALSNWQFTRSQRIKKRIVPWARAGLSNEDVEPGDYLLSWERKGRRGLRYLHVVDEQETERMAAGAGLRVVETFRADGVTGDLSEYVVMEHGKL